MHARVQTGRNSIAITHQTACVYIQMSCYVTTASERSQLHGHFPEYFFPSATVEGTK